MVVDDCAEDSVLVVEVTCGDGRDGGAGSVGAET